MRRQVRRGWSSIRRAPCRTCASTRSSCRCPISGRLTEAGTGRPRLAIALNGRVAAVTRAFEEQGELAFLTVVSPDTLRAGDNRLAVYEISGEGPALTLGSVPVAGQVQYALEDDGKTLRGPGGQIRVEDGAVRGFVDVVSQEPGEPVTVGGWAATPAGEAADAVLLFAGDTFVAAREPSQERRDVAADLGPGALRSGFWRAPAPAPRPATPTCGCSPYPGRRPPSSAASAEASARRPYGSRIRIVQRPGDWTFTWL